MYSQLIFNWVKNMKNDRGIGIVQKILGLFMIASFAFLILGQFLLPTENVIKEGACQRLQAEWVRVLPDGTTESVLVPGSCQAQPGENVVIETVLPLEQEDTTFCMRSLQQELTVYVDEELRCKYSTLDKQPFGKTSTMTYVFFDIEKMDAGKTLRIELSSLSSYSGTFSEILTGERSEIWKYFLRMYAPSTVLAGVMFMLSLVVFCVGSVSWLFYKREMEIWHLGNGVMLASTWLLVESRLRQFMLPNSTVAMNVGFLIIMLICYPFSVYFNKVQKNRYSGVYIIAQSAMVLNFITSTTLQVLKIKDFFETMMVSHVILIGTILLMIVTILIDMKRGYIKEYKEVAIGTAVFMLCGVWEVGLAYVTNTNQNGIALSIGLVFLLFTAGLKTGKDVIRVEKEKQLAITASESKANFLANMSHEIRTPINTVIGMNEMIMRENTDATIQEYATNIKSASHMLLGLVNDILDISKIDAGKLQIVESEYSLENMLKDVILGVEVRAKNKNLELKTRIDHAMPSVLKGDDIRIKQILNNLMSNAIKYTEKGSVTFTVEGIGQENDFVLKMSVADTGMGIREEDMDTLFDSFRRLELKKNRYVEGTGLGLSITKSLVEQMGGEIQVESEVGKGSCFTVLIPQIIVNIATIGDIKEKAENQEARDGAAEVFRAPAARVLVVDDNKMNLKVIQALLKQSQVQLDMASGGNECLEMTKKKKYDLILMDHMMPEPDGVQTLHIMRNDKKNANHTTNVVVLTANAVGDVETEYRKKGFSDYLAKPIDTEKLEQILIKYLSARVVKK